RYSTLEAQEIYGRPEPWPGFVRFATDRVTRRRFGKSRMLPYLPMPWVWRLIYMYFVRLGFMDGKAGWFLCNFISSYEFLVQLKYRELVRTNGKPVLMVRGLAAAEGDPEAADFTRKDGALVAARSTKSSSSSVALETANGVHHEDSKVEVAARKAIARDESNSLDESSINRDQTSDETSDETVEVSSDGSVTPHHRALDDRSLHATGTANHNRFISPWSLKDNVMRVLWMIVQLTLFRPSFHNWYGWRRFLLKLFGAKIGRGVRIRPTVKVEIPWNLEIGDNSIVGDYAILYSLGKITLGKRVIISQYAHLCAGTHDYRYKSFPLIRPPITVGDEAWIAADAFVGPNVTIGKRAVLGARASAFRDIAPEMIAAGSPAREIKPRERFDDPNAESSPDLSHAAKA
ncbi:MAG TPA: WcaF family extracellular polysaccharide biosynthesis acetyltransferase, partial [Tepidisphaeraceae bacterium]|nr:WcaF family extracellular polysaccharide biosynthesis acetyltransferase [Tepidisphaeraceae bacterium]